MKKYLFLFLFLNSATLGFGQKSDRNSLDFPELKDFSKVSINIAAEVYIRQADSFRCRIEGNEDYLEETKATVKDGTLTIRRVEHPNWLNGIKRLTIYIDAPSFEKIDFSGAGSIVSKTKLTGDKLKLEVSGAGSANFQDVDYQHIDVELTGVGNIEIGGKAVSSTMEMSGTGNIDAFDLKADSVRCETSGVGNINCFANVDLQANVSGVGGIRYKGMPKNLRKSVSGIGKVVNRN